MKRLAVVILMAAATSVWADSLSTAKEQTGLAVTVYNGNLALVKDTRRVRLDKGVSRLDWRDVSARIQPETALLHGQSADPPTLLEQNFDFDLLTPKKLLEKSVGKTVTVIKTSPKTGVETTEKAVVLAANDGVVLKFKDRIETGIPGRLAFNSVPADLRDKPTLSMLLKTTRAGERKLELSYLTGGLTWKADYVAELNHREDAMDLNGWVTLTNSSGVAYRNAHLQLVAGEVNRVRPENGYALEAVRAKAMSAGAPPMREESLLDYHLYTLDRPTTLLDNQTKQVALMSARDVPVRKEYVLRGAQYYYRASYGERVTKLRPAVYLRFENKGGQMGVPLPKGIIRVYKPDRSGNDQFVGEDRIDATARNETVRVKLGEAFDITAKKKQTDYRKIADGVFETAYRLELHNAKHRQVEVRVLEPMPGDWRILAESLPHEKVDSHTARWTVPVPAGGQTALTWRVRVRY